MNNKISDETRATFRDWFREQLRLLEFYNKRPLPDGHYLIREFAKYCVEKGAPIDEASLGRYLRDDDPVMPTPERCRVLAKVLWMDPYVVLLMASYIRLEDCVGLLKLADAQRKLPMTLREVVESLNKQYRLDHPQKEDQSDKK